MLTTSLAGTSWQRGQAAAGASASGRPTNSSSASGCFAKKAWQAGKVIEGPWSPPMQSTARRTTVGARESGEVIEAINGVACGVGPPTSRRRPYASTESQTSGRTRGKGLRTNTETRHRISCRPGLVYIIRSH
jgi:hypothetical protein